MVVQGVVLAALIGAAVKGPAAFSAIVDKISTRRKDAAYEADKERAHKACLTLNPDIALLEAVLSEADNRRDNSPDIARIRLSRDSVRRASPTRAGKNKAKPKSGKKAAPPKATKKVAPKKVGKKAAPQMAKAAPKKKRDKKKAAPKKKVAKRKGTSRKTAAKRKSAPKKKRAKRNIGARKVARKT
jgi:outer membrane biosynthesis protein TonB